MGFRRKDGRAAIRNEIWIIPTVGCVNDIAKKMVADNRSRHRFHRGSVHLHPSLRLQPIGHDHAQTRKLLAALVRHPNAPLLFWCCIWAARTCSTISSWEELGEYDHDRVKFLTLGRDVEDELAAACDILKELAAYAGQFKREPIPVSELVVGMKCGGSTVCPASPPTPPSADSPT